MQKIIIAGPGNSGSGAVKDYLISRKDIASTFQNKEFRFVMDPNGLGNLYENFYNNFSINNASNSYKNFKIYCANLSNSKSIKQLGRIFFKNFISEITEFINTICHLKYNAMPEFEKNSLKNYDYFKFFFLKIFLKKQIKDINMYKMILPIEESIFIKKSIKLINNMIISASSNHKKIQLLDQCINIFNLENHLKFFPNSKVIIVLRDPRGTWISIKKNPSFAYTGMNVDNFINWYKFIYDKINFLKKKKILNVKFVQFEDFALNFEFEKKRILHFLSLDEKKIDENIFNIKMTSKNALYNSDNFKKNVEIKKIKNNLKDYLIY